MKWSTCFTVIEGKVYSSVYLLPVWLGEHYLTSLCFSFLICKIGIIMVLHNVFESEMSEYM